MQSALLGGGNCHFHLQERGQPVGRKSVKFIWKCSIETFVVGYTRISVYTAVFLTTNTTTYIYVYFMSIAFFLFLEKGGHIVVIPG